MIKVHEDTDDLTLRAAYGCFPTGVAAICAEVNGAPVGMAISSFTSVSLDPPLVSVCVKKNSQTWRILQTAPRLGVSVLGVNQANICRELSGQNADRFQSAGVQLMESGAVLIAGAPAWFECSIESMLDGGDHLIVLLKVRAIDVEPDRDPLIFHAGVLRRPYAEVARS